MAINTFSNGLRLVCSTKTEKKIACAVLHIGLIVIRVLLTLWLFVLMRVEMYISFKSCVRSWVKIFTWISVLIVFLPVPDAGHGKTPKDAASVRATHPIPAACGIYYFEVKIVSKGRDG